MVESKNGSSCTKLTLSNNKFATAMCVSLTAKKSNTNLKTSARSKPITMDFIWVATGFTNPGKVNFTHSNSKSVARVSYKPHWKPKSSRISLKPRLCSILISTKTKLTEKPKELNRNRKN